MTIMGKAWVLYDGRAECGDEFDAAVLEFAGDSRRELKTALDFWSGHDGVLFEYDAQGHELLNGRKIGHLREGKVALLAKCSAQTQSEKP